MARKPIDWSPSNWPKLLYQFFTSFKVATAVFVLMTLVTLLGTLAQVDQGLYAAKVKYFHSFFFTDKIFGIPVLLPGGLLLMIILTINMILGALVKVRKRWRGAGLLVSHFGMIMLLAGGFVTWAFATDGYMALYPGMSSNRVESYRDWQLEVFPLDENGRAKQSWILPSDELQSIRVDEQRSYDADGLPFHVIINGFTKNATPIPTASIKSSSGKGKEIDGFKLVPQDASKEAEQNLPGAYVAFDPDGEGEGIEAILWAGSYRFDPGEDPMPFPFTIDGQLYGAMLAKKSWNVPFEVRLDEFIFERHPGVSTARNYESRVTRVEGEKETSLEIKMNEPMRFAGYTFFQESFGPSDGKPGEMFSQFAVANNPADQWPLWSLVVTTIGLMIHFCVMLVDFIIRSRRKTAAATQS
ncbi:MAG: cytochrome c biogenesis protein ResB [Verrucomicrobiales bacterium]|nr:cytochrome c biogenesis protein ResB [Verrucomicrobiales bacterium]